MFLINPFISFPSGGGGGGGPTNFALASNGSTATASSVTTGGGGVTTFGPERTIDGYRHTNNNWNSTSPGSGWNGSNSTSDWVEVDFGTSRTITEVDIFTLADGINYNTDPTLADTFTAYGVIDYTVKYWNGASWVDIVVITGNNKVWRQHTFAAITTTKIRVYCLVVSGEPRLIEIEAWG